MFQWLMLNAGTSQKYSNRTFQRRDSSSTVSQFGFFFEVYDKK